MHEWYEEQRKIVIACMNTYGKVVAAGVVVLLLFGTLFTLVSLLQPKTLRVSFFDVGQGDAILIQTPSGHEMLIDGGADGRVLEKVSSKLGYFDRDIDVMVATHGDADHITGLIPVLQKYEVAHIVASPLKGHTGIFDELEKSIDAERAQVHVGKRGDKINFGDGVVAHILYPGVSFHGSEKATNDASVSMVVTYGDASVLLTGDLPSTHEGELLSGLLSLRPSREFANSNVTIYKAGHHGSKFSSSDHLLSYITPEYSVISAGKDNYYGHPNSETLERLSVYSQEILSTIDRGTISFTLDGTSIQVDTSK